MLNQQTIEKLYAMRMRGMADAFTQQQEDPQTTQLSFEERFATAGGPAVELATEPGVGAAAPRWPPTRSSLHGRHRLPCGARAGQAGGPLADARLGLGAPPSTYFPDGADRDRENISWRGHLDRRPAATDSPLTSPLPHSCFGNWSWRGRMVAMPSGYERWARWMC